MMQRWNGYELLWDLLWHFFSHLSVIGKSTSFVGRGKENGSVSDKYDSMTALVTTFLIINKKNCYKNVF
jgi:hypothetical protein